VFSLKYLRILT